MNIEPPQPKYLCTVCNKASSQKSHNDHHMRTEKHKNKIIIYKLLLQSRGLGDDFIRDKINNVIIKRARSNARRQ